MFGTGSGRRPRQPAGPHGRRRSTTTACVMWGRAWKEAQGSATAREGPDPGVRHIEGNPLFQLDAAQNDYFKKVVFTSEVKRLAFSRCSATWAPERGVGPVQHVVHARAGEQMRTSSRTPTCSTRCCATPTTCSATTSATPRRSGPGSATSPVLRLHALRAPHRVLHRPGPAPAHHAIVLKLDQLHKDEVDRLMGGKALPWTYGRMFFSSHSPLSLPFGEKVPGKDLYSIDLGRMSPTQSVVTDLGTEGPRRCSAFLSPLAQSLRERVSLQAGPVHRPEATATADRPSDRGCRRRRRAGSSSTTC
jgi:hypothetical protein